MSTTIAEAPTSKEAIRVEKRADGVAIVWMDLPGKKVNTLDIGIAEEFSRKFDELEKDASVKAVVFASAKEDSFIAGADIEMLRRVQTSEEARVLSSKAQAAMNRIADMNKPVVAAIHGACLGGGLELALACHGRVASQHPKTRLGLPEVQLGILPGAGGTQRLPRLIGIADSLDLMLTGKQLVAVKALKLGLVDEVVPPSILIEVAAKRALGRAGSPPTERRGKGGLRTLALEKNPFGRKLLFDMARKKTLKTTQGNYPAPERILDVVKLGMERGLTSGLMAEAEAFGALAVTPVAAELMNIFFATRELEKDRGTDEATIAPRSVRRVGVLGAGLMGSGIAYVTAAKAGRAVRMKDRDDDAVRAGLRSVRQIVDEDARKKRISRFEAERLMNQVTSAIDYSGFASCDLVIEAVFEDLELKRRVLREVEEHGPENVIFASNTSSIPITRIAEASKHPETVIGMHYFSPVQKMPLLEIIVTKQTAPDVTVSCWELGRKQGKTVIVVNDGTGFYTSRVLVPFINEAFYVLADGEPIEKIDKALLRYGFPVGPVKLTDEVGIDVGAKVAKIMHEAFGDRLAPPKGLEKLVADDRKGRKNGRGFYRYEQGPGGPRSAGVDGSVYATLGLTPGEGRLKPEDIAWRCCLAFVNEAALCLDEGILRSPRDGDIGAIFGLGFPPFRGGPFRMIDAVGAKEIADRLKRLRDQHGGRFEPAPLITELEKSGRKLYPE